MQKETNGQAASFEDAIREHLIENRQTLVKSAVSSAMERMADSLKWTAMSAAQTQMEEFFKNEVGPEIQKYLEGNREALIASVIGVVKQAVDAGLKAYAEDIAKDMGDEYKRNKRIASLFGIQTRY